MTASKVKYSRLNNADDIITSSSANGDSSTAISCLPRSLTWNKLLGGISCFLFSLCVLLSILLAKVLEENSFLSSDYTNYTGSYSFGVVSDLKLSLSEERCCDYETQYSCMCCPNRPPLVNATFTSFVAVLKMYVNTKFILYLGNIASHSTNTVITYSYFSDFIKSSSVEIPVFPTLGLNDIPEHADKQLFYSEIHQTWVDLIRCFGCPLAPGTDEIKDTITKGGYYSISTTYGICVISVNTNLFLKNATAEDRSAAVEQLTWLENTFISTRDNHQSKILIGGVAPGLNRHELFALKSNSSAVIESDWDPDLQLLFTQLLDKYQFRFAAVFMGGAEFELVRRSGGSYMFLTPPCSPIHCSNPVFRVAFLSQRDLQLQDLHQYYTPLEFFTRANMTPKFMFDYAYERIIFEDDEAHGVTVLSSYAINRLYDKLLKEYTPTLWEKVAATQKIYQKDQRLSPLISYCTCQHSNVTLQLACLEKFKY